MLRNKPQEVINRKLKRHNKKKKFFLTVNRILSKKSNTKKRLMVRK